MWLSCESIANPVKSNDSRRMSSSAHYEG
jgi:hypothetical protein